MAKQVKAVVKLQIEAGKATPAPPVGPASGQHGANIMGFVKEYNERTSKMTGNIIIYVWETSICQKHFPGKVTGK